MLFLKNTAQLYFKNYIWNPKLTPNLSFETLKKFLGVCSNVEIPLQNHYTTSIWNECFASLMMSYLFNIGLWSGHLFQWF